MSERIIPLFSSYRLIQNSFVYPLGTDTVLLSSFARPPQGASAVCDLGTGGGAALILTLARHPSLHGVGIEINPDAAATARRNMEFNGLSGRTRIITGDLRIPSDDLRPASFSLVIANPPYFERKRGLKSPGAAREAARGDEHCGIDELCQSAARLLPTGGRFCLVWRAERMCDLMLALRSASLEPKRIRFIQTRAGAPSTMLLCEAVRGAGAGLFMEPPLVLHAENGGYTAETREIYAGGMQKSVREENA